MNPTFANASETCKRLNPHVFGGAVGAVERDRAKPTALQALDSSVPQPTCRQNGVGIRVVLVSFRRRLLDAHENLPYAFKPLVDAIAASLGIDDADPRVSWEYHQCVTRGQTGCVVTIERTL